MDVLTSYLNIGKRVEGLTPFGPVPFVQQAKSKSMANLALFADEDGIELEFLV